MLLSKEKTSSALPGEVVNNFTFCEDRMTGAISSSITIEFKVSNQIRSNIKLVLKLVAHSAILFKKQFFSYSRILVFATYFCVMNIWDIRAIQPADNPFMAAIIRDTLAEFGANKPGTVYYDSTTDALYELFQKERAAYFIAAIK